MRIALLTEVVSLKSGSRAPIEVAKALQKIGNKITLFAYSKNAEESPLNHLRKIGVNVILINQRKLLAWFEIRKQLSNGNYDIISFHGTLPFFIGAKISGIPIVTTYYGTQIDAIIDNSYPNHPDILLKVINYIGNIWIKTVGKIITSNSNTTVSISRYCQKEVNNLYRIKSLVVYLGCPRPQRIIHKKSNKIINILSVSRIVPYKGFHKLIKIFNDLTLIYPNIKLTIIGSSPNPNYLNFLKKISSKNVRFIIGANDRELSENYKSSDIYVTFDKYLFFGMPVLEAASFGIPTVSMNYCAAEEVIKNKVTGFVSKNEKEFSRNLKKLIKLKNLRTKLGKNAIKYAENFNWQKTAKSYEKIFNKTRLHFRS